MTIKEKEALKNILNNTIISVIASVIITMISIYVFLLFIPNINIYTMGLSISILAPLIIVPFIIINLIKLKDELYLKNIQLDNISKLDNLTGVYNRNYFNELAYREIDLVHQSDYSLSLIIIDYDNFKYINDNFGHNNADDILKVTSHIIKNKIDISDIVARYGNDQFIILLQNISYKKLKNLSNEICNDVNRIVQINNEDILMSVSIGCTIYSNIYDNKNLSSFISRGNEALLEAKKNGKNTVVIKTV